MSEAEKELKKKKYKKLIEDLSRITNDMKSLDGRAKTCRNIIKENVTIDYNIYQDEEFKLLEKEIKNITNNVENNIIPSLVTEMNK